jgi:hypothetical protein
MMNGTASHYARTYRLASNTYRLVQSFPAFAVHPFACMQCATSARRLGPCGTMSIATLTFVLVGSPLRCISGYRVQLFSRLVKASCACLAGTHDVLEFLKS